MEHKKVMKYFSGGRRAGMSYLKEIGDIYGVILTLKIEYENQIKNIDNPETFETFYKRRIEQLSEKAFEWLIEDERESNDKIAQ